MNIFVDCKINLLLRLNENIKAVWQSDEINWGFSKNILAASAVQDSSVGWLTETQLNVLYDPLERDFEKWGNLPPFLKLIENDFEKAFEKEKQHIHLHFHLEP